MSGAKLQYMGQVDQDKCKGCNEYIWPKEMITFINGRNFFHVECAEEYEQKEKKPRI